MKLLKVGWMLSLVVLLKAIILVQCCWLDVPFRFGDWRVASRGRMIVLDNDPLRQREVAQAEQLRASIEAQYRHDLREAHGEDDATADVVRRAYFAFQKGQLLPARPTSALVERAYDPTLLIPILAFLPILGLYFVVREHRRPEIRKREGRCANCGFDLRATPGRCPECGTGYRQHPSICADLSPAEREIASIPLIDC